MKTHPDDEPGAAVSPFLVQSNHIEIEKMPMPQKLIQKSCLKAAYWRIASDNDA